MRTRVAAFLGLVAAAAWVGPVLGASSDDDSSAWAINSNIRAGGLGSLLNDRFNGLAEVTDLGCEDDNGFQCHTMVESIRVIAFAREKEFPAVAVMINAPMPADETKLILMMEIISTLRPDIEKPLIGSSIKELLLKAARLSNTPVVSAEGLRLSIQVTDEVLMVGASKAE